tara:strand:- start:2775 stop:3068 length:294 start_codon:yes stop_codon:yes gene_type:complete
MTIETMQKVITLFEKLNSNGMAFNSWAISREEITDIHLDGDGRVNGIDFNYGLATLSKESLRVEFSGADVAHQENWCLRINEDLRTVFSINNENGAD